MGRSLTRREFLTVAGIGAAGLVAGCGGSSPDGASIVLPGADGPSPTPSPARPADTPAPTATNTPVPTPSPRPQGHETRTLMAGSPWETPVSIRSTGLDGPALMILGGVHGNEPGGWFAADEIATWEPAAGVLAVVPRANQLAIAQFLRLIDGEGDLNRQYPGDPDSETPMSRLAAEITGLARELEADVLLDLHESWSFYVDREAVGFVNREVNGTAFLGQTITGGVGPRAGIATRLAEAVNPLLGNERERFITREGSPFARNDTVGPNNTRGRSSLALGGHLPGLTPVLVETGQEGQAVDRRTELHLMVAGATMELLGI